MNRIQIVGAFVFAVVSSFSASAREIRDAEAKVRVTVPNTWQAQTRSSKDLKSVLWVLASPKEEFRVLVRKEALTQTKKCYDLLLEYEKTILKERLGQFKQVPRPKEMKEDDSATDCGGMYVGNRPRPGLPPHPHLVVVGLSVVGTTVYYVLGEAETSNFDQRPAEFFDVLASLEVGK